jgi:hypothetical protein
MQIELFIGLKRGPLYDNQDMKDHKSRQTADYRLSAASREQNEL